MVLAELCGLCLGPGILASLQWKWVCSHGLHKLGGKFLPECPSQGLRAIAFLAPLYISGQARYTAIAVQVFARFLYASKCEMQAGCTHLCVCMYVCVCACIHGVHVSLSVCMFGREPPTRGGGGGGGGACLDMAGGGDSCGVCVSACVHVYMCVQLWLHLLCALSGPASRPVTTGMQHCIVNC